MNQAQKEAYLREYSTLKSEGEPFFPYSVTHDGVMACIVMAVIIFFSLLFGAELGPKADRSDVNGRCAGGARTQFDACYRNSSAALSRAHRTARRVRFVRTHHQ